MMNPFANIEADKDIDLVYAHLHPHPSAWRNPHPSVVGDVSTYVTGTGVEPAAHQGHAPISDHQPPSDPGDTTELIISNT